MPGKKLQILDTRNPKEIIMKGLQMKIDEQGTLRAAFDITSDYPSKETYEQTADQPNTVKRRIVVKKISNTVNVYGIGNVVGGDVDLYSDNMHDDVSLGWEDMYNMEISIWSPDSQDRDNIVELIKLWMLELEQKIQVGDIQLPYLFSKGVFAIKFMRATESQNDTIYRNGPIYIGTLTYEVEAPFFHQTQEELVTYQYNLIAKIVERINLEQKGN